MKSQNPISFYFSEKQGQKEESEIFLTYKQHESEIFKVTVCSYL